MSEPWHIRKEGSTPCTPLTWCGFEPKPQTFLDTNGREHDGLLKITEWEFVRSSPTMEGLCQKCVDNILGVDTPSADTIPFEGAK